MKTIFLFVAICCTTSLFNPALAQNSDTDTLFMGQWQLASPADAKMLKTAGEPFLKDNITFGLRNKFYTSERLDWEWRYNPENGILTIRDREMEEQMAYRVESVSQDELIILWGKTSYRLVYKSQKK